MYQNSAALAAAFHTFSYTALTTAPTLQFGFRNDGGMDYSWVDDVSVVATSAPSVQLLTNPSFENSTSTPTGWMTWCQSSCGSGRQGQVTTGGSCNSGNCFYDHCVMPYYDYLAQSFSATIGSTYTISFWSYQTGGPGGQLYVNVAG